MKKGKLIHIDGEAMWGLVNADQDYVDALYEKHTNGDAEATSALLWLNTYNLAEKRGVTKHLESITGVSKKVKQEIVRMSNTVDILDKATRASDCHTDTSVYTNPDIIRKVQLSKSKNVLVIIQKVQNEIKSAIDQGLYQCKLVLPSKEYNKIQKYLKRLCDEGFLISTSVQKNEVKITMSWRLL